MVRKEDVFPVGRHPSGWFLLVFIQLILIVTRDTMLTINDSSGPGELVTSGHWPHLGLDTLRVPQDVTQTSCWYHWISSLSGLETCVKESEERSWILILFEV